MPKQASYFAPGKLFIAGEYAVTMPEGEALIMPVKKGIKVSIYARKKSIIVNRQYPKENQKYQMISDINNPYIRLALEVVRQLLLIRKIRWRNFRLNIDSSLISKKGKYGLGSSGALTVAVIGALLKFYRINFVAELLFRLAVVATIHNYQDTSFGDVACSSFRQTIHYRKFLPTMVPLIKTLSVEKLLKMPWDGLMIQPLKKPLAKPLVIYSGTSASSHQLVKALTPHLTKKWTEHSNMLLHRFLTEKDFAILDAFNHHLETLENLSGQKLFTKGIRSIIRHAHIHQGFAKFSGAGGGDSVIAYVPKAQSKRFMIAIRKDKFLLLRGMI